MGIKNIGLRFISFFPESWALLIARSLSSMESLDRRDKNKKGRLDLKYQLRKVLWHYGRIKKISSPLQLKWYDDIVINSYLGDAFNRGLFVNGRYEAQEFSLLAQILEKDMHFVDVGANIGLYSLFAARRVGVGGRVTAFEPSQRDFDRFSEHIQLNKLTNIQAFQTALYNQNGQTELTIAGQFDSGQNTLGAFAHLGVSTVGVEEVSLRRLDDLMVEENLPNIDVMKIDAEGAEFAILNGALTVLKEQSPILILELFDPVLQKQGSNKKAVVQLLASFNYKLFGIDSATDKLIAIEDGFFGYNFVAIPIGKTLREIKIK